MAASPGQDRLVTLRSMHFTMAPLCAGCGAVPEVTLGVGRGALLGRLRRSLAVPFCRPCAARARRVRRQRTALAWATAALAIACATAGLVASALPLPALAMATTLLVATVAWIGARGLAHGDAVRLVAFRGPSSTLLCENAAWASALATANGAVAVPVSRPRPERRPLWVALILTPLAATAVWLRSHQAVFVDHAGPGPIAVWIDGATVARVEPRARWARPARVMVPVGRHRFGFSPAGAAAPASVVEAEVVPGHALLYNPGATACYVIAGPERRFVPPTELHDFGRVSSWFADDGEDAASDARSGGSGVAVEREERCTELAHHGCSRAARTTLVACLQAAGDARAREVCWAAACPGMDRR